MRQHRSRAFTLIELLVSISIIALLMGILLPLLSKSRLTANNIAGLNNLRQLMTQIYSYSTVVNGYIPTRGAVGKTRIPSMAGSDADDMVGWAGWTLWDEADLPDPRRNADDAAVGLGVLISLEFARDEFFYHPVMQDHYMDAGETRKNWWWRENFGFLSGSYPRPNGPNPGSPGFGPSDAFDGKIECTIAYRGGDRSIFPNAGTDPMVDADINLRHCQIEAPHFSGTTLLCDLPFDNQGNRMGGSLGYTLGDGSAAVHTIPEFFADTLDQNTALGNIPIVDEWPTNAGTQYNGAATQRLGGAEAAHMFNVIDQELGFN